MNAQTPHVLVFSTLFPNREQPQHGIFVEKRVAELRKRYDLEVRVIAPVPWFPIRSKRFGLFGAYARVPKNERRAGVDLYHPRYLVIPKLSWRIAPIFLFLASFMTLRRCRKSGYRIDIIDAHFVFPDGVAAQMLGRVFNIPVSLTARGSDINDSPRSWLPRAMLRWALKRAAVVIAVSAQLARAMAALGCTGERVNVLPNGVDTARFSPRESRIKTELGIDGPLVLSVGVLRTLKGHHLLIEAVASLEGVHLAIIGSGAERENLQNLARELGVEHRVHLLGSIANERLADYYCAADVFALASSHEGCPNVILEALACGTPIVASAVGAIPDLVPAVLRPYLVEQRTAAAFEQKIRDCLKHPPAPAQLLQRAQELNWDPTCTTLFKLFRHAIGAAG